MDSGTLAPVGSVAALRFDDPDAFTHALRGANVEYLPLVHGGYRADLTALDLNGVRIHRANIPPIVARGGIDPDSAILLFPITPGAEPVVNATMLDEAHVALLRPGDDFHAIVRNGLAWGTIGFDPGLVERFLDAWDLPMSIGRAPKVLGLGPAAIGQLRRTVTSIADLGEELPRMMEAPDVAIAIGKSLVDLVASMRLGPELEGFGYRRTGEVVRIMNAAEDYLGAHVMKPIYSEDLCQALGVSQRKLHAVFVAGCGVSPQAYLKYRRLVLVRRALRSGGAHAALVKSAALSHGFWHLGNFARDYRTYFGESPSETLRAVQAP